jgi:hypothetical protein
VDRVDDLGVVNSAQVDGGDPEVGMSWLGLDHNQGYALCRHLDGVRVAELVRGEPPPDASANRDIA